MNKNIPVNKGQFFLESEERIKEFEKKRSEGWGEDYFEYRKNWYKFPEKQFISEYPLHVDMELSTACNLKCPMCYTISEQFKQKKYKKFMEKELFYKVVDEISFKVPSLRLSLRGEPTLHPDFIKLLKYAKYKGIKEVSFLTNGSTLTDTFIENVILAGADWITISIDGINETYESIRYPLKFEYIYDAVKRISTLKKKYNMVKPVIKIQSIWPAIRETAEKYYNLFEPYVDEIAFNSLIDYLRNDEQEQILYEENFICPQLYQRIVILSDGNVVLCSNDEEGKCVIGDANHESVFDIWHGDKINHVRQIHKNTDGFKNIDICKYCYYPRLMQEDENTTINGRRIIIKNYINRTQVIGK
jgi:radical SAM protein with 4Fe4S-binding SPASM domain